MEKRSTLPFAAGVAAGVVLLMLDAVTARRKEIITIDQDMPVPPERVADLIMEVERETAMIPIINSVTVHSRTESEVVYSVRAVDPLPVTVRYRKWREKEPTSVRWETQSGTFGFREDGEITFTEYDGRCVAHLKSEHWVTTPIAGRIAAPAATGILRAELEVWLKHLSEELKREEESICEPQSV